MPALASNPPLLQMRNIRKSFTGVPVLLGVDFDLRAGEVHALVGENGAGKSTLIKVLAGVHIDHTGDIVLAGEPVAFRRPRDAEAAGIAVIYQELALVPYLTATENIFLGREVTGRLGGLDLPRMRRDTETLLRETLGVTLDVRRPVGELPIAVQQLVEIAKALARRARLLVMDEPTSALSDADAGRLFGVIRQLRDQGAGILYVSHKLPEIFALADRVTVLRDGRHVLTARTAGLAPAELVRAMVGRQVATLFPSRAAPPGAPRLAAEGIHVRDRATGRWRVQDASFTVRSGEILGLAGLMGSGTSELLGAVFGRDGPPERGRIRVDGVPAGRVSPARSIAAGVCLLTNDRKASGLVLPMSVLHNLTLARVECFTTGGVLRAGRERAAGTALGERLRLRCPSLSAEVAALSGGNQQKVVLARWLLTGPKVLLLDEPTRGIDVGAKADIYALLNELAAAGTAIVLISSELPELLGLSDRVVVLHAGRIVAEFPRSRATQERVLHAAMGGGGSDE